MRTLWSHRWIRRGSFLLAPVLIAVIAIAAHYRIWSLNDFRTYQWTQEYGQLGRDLWILLMSPLVTGRSLSPIKTEIAGLLPVSKVEVSASVRGAGNHHAGSGRPVTNEDMRHELQPITPILLRRRSARQKHVRPRPRRQGEDPLRGRPARRCRRVPPCHQALSQEHRRRSRVHVRLVLARRPVRGPTPPLRPRPCTGDEARPWRQDRQ